MQFNIFLKFTIRLCKRCLLTDFNIIRSIISNNSAPQRIIQIKIECLFVFSINRFNNIGYIKCQIWNCRHCYCVLIHVPIIRLRPFIQSVRSRNIVYITNIEIIMFLCILIKSAIKHRHKIHSSMIITCIFISH